MQERVVLNVGLPLVDSCPADCDDFQSQKALTKEYQQQIITIIDKLPSVIINQSDMISYSEKCKDLLDYYQEQPNLLDSYETIIQKLLSYIKWLENGQSRFDSLSNLAFSLLAHISKIRGYKAFMSLLPHEVNYLEKVLSSLERYDDYDSFLDVPIVLLYWLLMLCKNPFDLNKFDTKKDGSTVERIINVSLPYLYLHLCKAQHAAALLLSLIVTREDARAKYLMQLIESCISTVENSDCKSSADKELVGSLQLIAAVLKAGKREDLLNITRSILKVVQKLSNVEDTDTVVKKLEIKVAQRLGMVFLKPRIPKWRYDCGNRCLTLKSGVFGDVQKFETLEMDDSAEEEIYDVPLAELEIVLATILKALRDRDTTVRWFGAKGIGRIVSRLPKHLANDVLNNIFKFNFNPHSGNAAWHGGCLAIAELARRGFLLLEKLSDVVAVISDALIFEESRGRHALGATVRDAACYVCWSVARCFRPNDLKKYNEQIATSLVCVALFDREINVRRAASAAFQEFVGRQGTFPNGIEILTKIDYFAVGLRNQSYLEISCQVAKYPLYARAIIEHLIRFKIVHWDEEIRFLAAKALNRLCPLDSQFVQDQIHKKIIPLVSSQSLIQQQSGVLAVAATLSGLKNCGQMLDIETYRNVAQIPSIIYPLSEKRTRSLASGLMRRTLNFFIKMLSSVIPKEVIKDDDWFRCLEQNFKDENKEIRNGACEAGEAFFKLYTAEEDAEFLAYRIHHIYIPQVINANVESDREGAAAILGVIPKEVLLLPTSSGCVATDIIHTLISVISGRSSRDATWAYGRCACVEAIVRIVKLIDLEPLDNIPQILDCLIDSLDDYSLDHRGDVGRILREETMRALAVILPLVQNYQGVNGQIFEAVCRIIQQSIEKIDATRECAAMAMNQLLTSGMKGIKEEQILRKIYVDNYEDTNWKLPSCFMLLASLLKIPCYRYHALNGFVISAGGITESTKIGASDALLSSLSDIRESRQELEVFLQCFASIMVNNASIDRVILPMLETLEQILMAQILDCFESDPDSSPSLRKIVDIVAAETTIKVDVRKEKICITVLCHFLHFNSSSQIWHKSATLATHELYESLASECDSNDEAERNARLKLLDILSKTDWRGIKDKQYFENISHTVAQLLNLVG